MTLALLQEAATAAARSDGPEAALRALLRPLHRTLGQREGSPDLPAGEAQFFVAGAFMVAPDAGWHMLTASLGFPPEQSRLMIPLAAGHPGRVHQSGEPLHLQDTEAEPGAFKQYLKTARMGSAIYAPMIWQHRFLGQIVLAARARSSLRAADFATMCAAAPVAAALWIAQGGPAWLERSYPPADGFRVGAEGL